VLQFDFKVSISIIIKFPNHHEHGSFS
jgi:hypothetical protein